MKCALLLIASCLVIQSKALECGFEKISKSDMKTILTSCEKDNEKLEKLWDLVNSITSSSESSERSDSSSTEDSQSNNQSKARKSRETGKVQGGMIQVNERRTPSNSTESSSESSLESTTTVSSVEFSNCFSQCFYKMMKITDDKGFPDHGKIIEEIFKATTDRELRVFGQESVDDCFQQLDKEGKLDACVYSNKLGTCLALKAKMNCSDFPADWSF